MIVAFLELDSRCFFNGLFEVPYYRINSPESPAGKCFENIYNMAGCQAIPIAWNITEGTA